MNEAKIELINKMTKIVLKKLKSHMTDFTCYDIPYIVNHDEPFYWFVRNTGTHLLTDTTSRTMYDCYQSYNDMIYYVNPKTGILKEV